MIVAERCLAQARELQSVLELLSPRLLDDLEAAAAAACESLRNDGGVYFVGNGGSAAEAEHLAAELVGRFARDRSPLRAGALTSSGAVMTALSNDYPPEELFARQVRGILHRRDTLVALSTSGRSTNVLRALDEAGRLGCTRIGLTGRWTADFEVRCDWVLSVPSASTARIQEVHLMLGHAFCEIVENTLSPVRMHEEELP
jgi:D-sedoheptulose 7-phosphate isomerase